MIDLGARRAARVLTHSRARKGMGARRRAHDGGGGGGGLWLAGGVRRRQRGQRERPIYPYQIPIKSLSLSLSKGAVL